MTRFRRLFGQRKDEGLGMVLVIATIGIISTLMIVTTATAINSVQSSRKHVSSESALSVAESGIDIALSRAQYHFDTYGMDSYLSPAPSGDPSCAAASQTWPFSTQPSAADERAWAKNVLATLALTPACRATVRGGEVVILKPSGHAAVYALAWSPKYQGNEAKSRLLKAEYLFSPYTPNFAVLTGSNVEIASSTTVTSAPPNAASLAAVHSNANVTVSNGNPTVYGLVSQSGTGTAAQSNKFYGNTNGTVAPKPKQSLPKVTALKIWGANHATAVPGGWYDLCTGAVAGTAGQVRAPDGSAPCTGTILSTTGSFRGWTYDGSGSVKKWIATSAIKQNGYSGTYYIDGGDAVASASNAGASVPNLTVLAASLTQTCDKVGGNISWDHIDISAPSIDDLFMMADQDLLTTANFAAGSAVGGNVIGGEFIAGDQIQLETSSNGAYGSVIAIDKCDPDDGDSLVDSNIVKNPSVYFDPNAKSPFTSIVNTTLWLEYGI